MLNERPGEAKLWGSLWLGRAETSQDPDRHILQLSSKPQQIYSIWDTRSLLPEASADGIPRLLVSTCASSPINQLSFVLNREWDRFAKTEYERLAMEEEQGEDSEVLDAMDGWDSEEETGNADKEKGEGKDKDDKSNA